MTEKYFSWVIDDDKAIKEVDTSVIDSKGSGIPKEIRYFWSIDDMQEGEVRYIKLYDASGVEHRAYFAMRNNRTRLFWNRALADSINIPKEYNDEMKDQMIFLKTGKDMYLVKYVAGEIQPAKQIRDPDVFSKYTEGKRIVYYTSKHERNAKNRKAAIRNHGLSCAVCGFDFEKIYGEVGKGYIEVHHRKPLSSVNQEVVIDPKEDLITVCSNCHRMLHRRKDRILTVEELRVRMKNNK